MKSNKISDARWVVLTNVKKLGNKQEPYHKKESEMLFDTEYTYESLSESEKLIYNKPKQKKI
tara:strand:+ start:113 stop:298 length:186 start_codon:yes stop_codon:yes gene_type:complete